MTFSEALAIVKEKATSRNFDRKLTETEREALAIYLTHENYYYLQGQIEGEIGRLKESGAKEYVLEIILCTAQEGAGKNLFEKAPLNQKVYTASKVERIDSKTAKNPYYFARILEKEIQNAADYLENLSFALPL